MSIKCGFNAESVVEEGRTSWNDIRSIRNWLKTVEIPSLSDEQIVCFLLSCKNKEEPTKRTIKEYYNARYGAPALFNGRNIFNTDIQYQLNIVDVCVFPEPTDDGCLIVCHRLNDSNYWNYTMEVAMKILFMTLDVVVYDRPPKGLIILFDMRGVGLMHLTKARLGLVKTFCHYLQEGLPVRLKEIHILNCVYFIEKVIAIIRPFTKKEVMDMILFHPPTLDMELFYTKYIPKKCLPKDFGGDLPSVRDLHDVTVKKLESMIPYFDAEEKQRQIFKC